MVVMAGEARGARGSKAPTESTPSRVPKAYDPNEDGQERSRTVKVGQVEPLSLRTSGRARLTVMTGVGAGQVMPVEHDILVIGRGREADFRVEDAGVSRKHARIERLPNGPLVVEDLGSTNGTLVNGEAVVRKEIGVGDRIQIGPNLVLQFDVFDDAEESLARRLYDASIKDPLTGAFNRRYFAERLRSEISYAVRHKTAVGVILFDIDHFKKVNDQYGHAVGDEVLVMLVRTVLSTVRIEDTLARFGGEEFALLVRGLAHGDLVRCAERVRSAVAASPVAVRDNTIPITLSAGAALLSECESPDGNVLVTLSDTRLYRAKTAGRDQTCATDT
jgi:two-component system cell cycle response regulator